LRGRKDEREPHLEGEGLKIVGKKGKRSSKKCVRKRQKREKKKGGSAQVAPQDMQEEKATQRKKSPNVFHAKGLGGASLRKAEEEEVVFPS